MVAVAALVLPLAVLTALRIVTNEWIVDFEIDHGALPADRLGMTSEERRELALLGLESIRPGGAGVGVLVERSLASGEPAFTQREIEHMQDVRDMIAVAFRLHLVLVVVLVVAALGLAVRPATRALVPRGLRLGALATLGFACVSGLAMAFAWEPFFDGFHNLFFEGRTWYFDSEDTLLRVYPSAFWLGVGIWLAAIAIAFALLTLAGSTLWLRRLRRTREA
jgi:integral membrane protein (TIGR01906 family)